MARYTIRFIENHEEKVTPSIMHKEGEVMRNVREGTMRHFCDKGVAEVIKEVPEPAPVEKKDPAPKVAPQSFASQAARVSQPKTAPKRKAKPKSSA